MRRQRDSRGPDSSEDYRPALLGLLAVQFILGYEWFLSGLSKLLKGGFVNGLKEDLVFRSSAVPAWYERILTDIAIPNSRMIGAVVVIGELFLGAALIAASLLWATRWGHLSTVSRTVVLSVIVAAGVIAILANVNYHIYTAASHPWIIAADPFAEGVDLDSLMPVLQAILAAVSLRYLVAMHRA